MKKQELRPPKLSDWILSRLVKSDLHEEISGDLHEYYTELSEKSRWKRMLFFWFHFFHFLRPFAIKKIEGTQKLNNYGMLKNDMKTSWRIIKREKLYSAINILGLSSGFVIAILILFYVQFEKSYESYNENADKVVRITMDYLDGETVVDQDCETYHVLGPMIKEEFPEVTDFARAYRFGLGLKVGDQVFREPTAYAVDPSFLTLFDYPLLKGDIKTVLHEPRQMVLTESTAMKFFGTTEVIGEVVMLNEKNSFNVVGVVEDSPANTHFKFNVLISYASMKKTFEKRESPWNQNDTFTYLQLDQANSYDRFKTNLAVFSDRLRAEDHIPDERIISQKIERIHLHSDKSYEAEQNGSATIVLFLLGVALSVITIAVLNYINLSTAKALDRAREAGIRKIIGSSVGQLRVRFFLESVMLNAFAGVISILVIWAVFEPYKALAGLPKSLDILYDLETWLVLGGLMIISTILSGVFPAIALGSFKPLEVLKGKFSHSARGVVMRKGLVTIQFAIAIFLLIQTFTANQQLTFMLNKDLGMNTEKVVVIPAPPPEAQQQTISDFKSNLLSRAAFKNVGLSSTVPGLSTSTMGSTTNITLDEEARDLKNNFYWYHIDSNFFKTMEMEMVAGDDFSTISNYEHPVIINEEALKIWGIPNPEDVINKKTSFWGRENTIVGVVKNFHQLGAKNDHIVMGYLLYKDTRYADYISVRLGEGPVLQQVAELEELYNQHFPSNAFDFFFLDQNFDKQYRADQQFLQIFNVLSGFAILITCLGLFGLASFTAAKRTKEIGIRKVLGASISQIVRLLSKDFVRLVAISSIIAIPLTYLLVQNWLDQYSFRISVSVWLFVPPTFFVLMVAFGTVFSKAMQASRINPVESLRDE